MDWFSQETGYRWWFLTRKASSQWGWEVKVLSVWCCINFCCRALAPQGGRTATIQWANQGWNGEHSEAAAWPGREAGEVMEMLQLMFVSYPNNNNN